jgi:hypothetical protein
MPEFLKWFFYETGGLVQDRDKWFSKKKESENYAYLLVVRKLFEYGLYGEDFYPNLDQVITRNLTRTTDKVKGIDNLGVNANSDSTEFRPIKKQDKGSNQ